ncbi:aspartate aminotransferase family protein [Adlercreutzia sp. ZJ138]|uniref:aspartate aminotransferase family protein n=1 Tax=Adlercreutzia sp. ZJ138 TaxID=2709405 RepID=UPI0013EC786D|nr:aspartate aminotransferase family protein [Adlercreutzia sp. ZJ138]
MGFAEQRALESEYVMGTFARKPVQLVEGAGMRVVDSEGNQLLDFIAGIGVCSLGHCHPALVNALSEQAHKLVHVSNYYYIENRGEVAKMVSDLMNVGVEEADQEVWQSFFSNSGAESNECAIKLSRLYARKRAAAQAEPGKQAQAFAAAPRTIVVMERSFHGRTLATLAATAQPVKQEAFMPLPDGFVATPLNDIAALEQLFEQQGDSICAIMLEPIQGESGVHPATPEFMQAARRLTAERGALLVCDEVQCGIFRTGKPFGFQNFGVVPDIVTIAKGVASGFPMGMCAARASVAAAFEPGDHGTTFGGSNLAVSSALAVLRTIRDEAIAENVLRVGAYMRERLASLPGVVEVRGFGLMNAADLREGVSAPDVVSRALGKGLLLNATGPSTLRFLPPLICTEADVDALVEALGELLG